MANQETATAMSHIFISRVDEGKVWSHSLPRNLKLLCWSAFQCVLCSSARLWARPPSMIRKGSPTTESMPMIQNTSL